ncbi:enoyl-CoA hydratase/isomerase family protein [Subtercola boreus]|uniref:Enoyl-CoA hydratase n=1 Tax=Subtercola boreus TaxID=120213 RepID=A0A3E0W7N6_9MICO|nr:enoyl-CoA hydratase/isomerase family protein [Subtercola boreus]RFA19095.1 enoyl-CoA hydratase [Subtercola boreus]RFA19233.1 enoyl-CoA hydratase [Subtercola boreus]RFA25695.1 enoyl-CoA hydratase [Subtercola boreus]
MELDRIGEVFVIRLDEGENRFDPGWVGDYLRLLDEAEAATDAAALVTAGTGKFFSNGLDLEWITAHRAESGALLADVHELLARVLESSLPTVAAVQGHCYAAGAMLAIAHDFRVMREDRGFICLPEIDIRIPFTPGMADLVSGKLSPQTARDAMLFGTRYAAPDARRAGIVDDVAPADAAVDRAITVAAALVGKDTATLRAIKQTVYAHPLASLRNTAANTPLRGVFAD